MTAQMLAVIFIVVGVLALGVLLFMYAFVKRASVREGGSLPSSYVEDPRVANPPDVRLQMRDSGRRSA